MHYVIESKDGKIADFGAIGNILAKYPSKSNSIAHGWETSGRYGILDMKRLSVRLYSALVRAGYRVVGFSDAYDAHLWLFYGGRIGSPRPIEIYEKDLLDFLPSFCSRFI